MRTVLNNVAAFVGSETAASATEYAVMMSLIVLAAVGAISILGGKVAAASTVLSSRLPH